MSGKEATGPISLCPMVPSPEKEGSGCLDGSVGLAGLRTRHLDGTVSET